MGMEDIAGKRRSKERQGRDLEVRRAEERGTEEVE